MARKKRTFNLSEQTIETVKLLVTASHVASSQDELVEKAINDFALRVRDREHARQWASLRSNSVERELLNDLVQVDFGTDEWEW